MSKIIETNDVLNIYFLEETSGRSTILIKDIFILIPYPRANILQSTNAWTNVSIFHATLLAETH